MNRFFRTTGLAITLLSAAMANTTGSDPTVPGLSLEWVDPPHNFAQGVVECRVRVKNVSKRTVTIANWIAEGWGWNFTVYISQPLAGAKSTALQPVTPRGFVKFQTVSFSPGEYRDLRARFVLDNRPSNYQLIAKLSSLPAIASKPITIHVDPGTTVDIGK
jgi:hypothetical protein